MLCNQIEPKSTHVVFSYLKNTHVLALAAYILKVKQLNIYTLTHTQTYTVYIHYSVYTCVYILYVCIYLHVCIYMYIFYVKLEVPQENQTHQAQPPVLELVYSK